MRHAAGFGGGAESDTRARALPRQVVLHLRQRRRPECSGNAWCSAGDSEAETPLPLWGDAASDGAGSLRWQGYLCPSANPENRGREVSHEGTKSRKGSGREDITTVRGRPVFRLFFVPSWLRVKPASGAAPERYQLNTPTPSPRTASLSNAPLTSKADAARKAGSRHGGSNPLRWPYRCGCGGRPLLRGRRRG